MSKPHTNDPPSSPAAAPRRGPRGWWQMLKQAGTAWVDDRAPSMGAALSYYSVFSIAPLLLIVISIAGLVFGQDAVRGEIFGQLQSLLGGDAAQAIQAALASVSEPEQGVLATLIGLVVLLVGATTVFAELQDALDRIWEAPERDRTSGIWGLLRSRLLSFGMILGIAFLLMVSLVFSAAVAALGKWWGGGPEQWLLQALNIVVGFALTTGVFALIYKLMPRVRVAWHDVWLGAAVTALLFTIGRALIGQYIGRSGIASGYGAAGSMIVVLVWVYYSAQIFLFGAEFTWVYAQTHGSKRDTAAARPNGATSASAAPPAAVPMPSSAAPARPAAWRTVSAAPDAGSSLRAHAKRIGLGVAAGLAIGGLLWQRLRRERLPWA